MALGAQYGFTVSFEPSQDIKAGLMNVSGAIGGFQEASETSEEDGIWQELTIKHDLSCQDPHSLASSQDVKLRPVPLSPSDMSMEL